MYNKMYDTVSLPYIIERLDGAIENFTPDEQEKGIGDAWHMHKELQELRHELIYNMGVNSFNRKKETIT